MTQNRPAPLASQVSRHEAETSGPSVEGAAARSTGERGLGEEVQTPPGNMFGILARLGPGFILAGSIVGSGELIATTKTGAEAGFWLLWLILIGCVIKVFVQVEFGRYSIVNGLTTMTGLTEVPGPRVAGRGNWLVWYWFLMWMASIGQLGGIVGGVGQALAISLPLTESGRQYNEYAELKTALQVKLADRDGQARSAGGDPQNAAKRLRLQQEIDGLESALLAADRAWEAKIGKEAFERLDRKPPPSYDDRLWAAVMAVGTSILLMAGRYGLIQNFATILVCGFTIITLGNLIALQNNLSWRVTGDELLQGLSFRLPPHSDTALATALATFGIIGVGAHEIIAYPYWCIEKGYARFAGPRDSSQAWVVRAQGWMRVMRWDAWCSMITYTFATMGFYLLGAAILGRSGLNPAGTEMVRTLAVIYQPVFSEWAAGLFLIGAFAILYSTYFVANAGHARVFADALGVVGMAAPGEAARRRRITLLSGLFPMLCLVIYVFFPQPTKLVLLSGVMQAFMLPMLAVAALYFRYRRHDPRLVPGRLWDLFLWLSAAGMLVAGVWAMVSQFL